MIKDFQTYISEGLFDRNQSEFAIRKTDRGIEQIYVPKTKEELYSYIDIDIEQAKKEGTYPNVNLNNIDVSELGDDALAGLFSHKIYMINPDISDWNIKSIPNRFFNGNKQIEEFTIPDNVTSIVDWAFLDCGFLTSVTIPNSVTSIGAGVFYGCSGLTSVTIPNSVTSIGDRAFSDCSDLTSVTIPNSVTSIGWGAFYGCSGLTSVTIPNSVTSIEEGAFYQCSGLTSVTIPNSVTSIGWGAFYGCSGLTSVTIPNSVTSIGEYAFYKCSSLTSVTIGNSVTSIGEYAFEECSGLTSITIPNSVTSIGAWAFDGTAWFANQSDGVIYINQLLYTYKGEMPANTSIVVLDGTTQICGGAFGGCSGLTSVTIPNSVTSIGDKAFGNCTQLTNIVCYAAVPPSCDASSFANYDASLKVPYSSLEAYKAAAVWRDFNNISYIESTVGLEQIELAGLYTQAGRIVCEGEFRIYDLLGRDVTRLNGSLSGVYVVKTANAAVKVVVR